MGFEQVIVMVFYYIHHSSHLLVVAVVAAYISDTDVVLNLYVFSLNIKTHSKNQMKRTRNASLRHGVLPLTYVTTYARKDDVPFSDGTLFAVDHVYPESKKEKSSRFFRMDFIDFYLRLMITPRDKCCYYECIEGDKRKPYADIEYEFTDANKNKAVEDFDLIIGHLLLGIQYEMHEKGVLYDQEKDCIILSSHGPNKRSIHIIINNYYFDKCSDVHNSNVKSFWLSVRNRVPQHLWHFAKIKHGSETIEKQLEVDTQHNKPLILDNIRSYKKKDKSETIDTCVYSSFRQFRLVWNTKIGKERFLEIDPSTGLEARNPKNSGDPVILDENLQRLRLFEGCLITMTSNCKKLPDWVTPIVDTTKQNAYKNIVDIDDKQRNTLIDAFNSSRHANIYRINYHQSTSKNSIYLDPVTKPYDCLICGGNHSGNNAKLCYSAKGNIYIKCFASNKIDYIGKDFIKEADEDDDASDFEGESLEFFGLDDNYLQFAQQNGITVPDNVLKSIESNSITGSRNNKLDEDSAQINQRRVQATPIINGVIQQLSVENSAIRASPTSATAYVNDRPIINIETTKGSTAETIGQSGQCQLPTKDKTIATFLEGNTKLYVDLSQINQRHVQSNGTIESNLQQLSVENFAIRASPTSATAYVNDRPIINIETTKGSTAETIGQSGQIVPPSSLTTIATFLDGNTKFIAGYEYIIQEIFDAYERYRNGFGKKYTLNGGSDKTNFGRALTALGHTTNQKKIKGSNIRVVTLKRSDPITNTNPIEAINKITGKTVDPSLKPDEAFALLQQNFNNKNVDSTPTTATATTPIPQPIDKASRMMNPHVDVRNFWDIYMTKDPESNTDPDNLFKCFLEYCKQNNAVPNRFGQRRLLNYLKKWLNIDSLNGWRCKTDMEEIENAKKEKNLRRIWQWNTAPYQIGWHNGRFVERYCKLTSKPWKKIDVHYHNDKYCKPIPQLIEMTNAFENNLPDRVKEIQQQQLVLLFMPIDSEEANKLKLLVTNALLAGVITADSPEHVALKNRIVQLEKEEFQRNQEEYDRLEESIKADKARLLEEVSWCCAVRSTFRTGKTFNLRPYIEAFPEMRVLIILPRTTLTDEYMIEYRAMGFVIYTEKPKGKINDPRVIVCYPSITRLDLTENYDLLVLDEFKAIKDLQHTLVKKMMRKKDKTTGIYKSRELKCYQVLCQLVANTKRVYVADALLTNAHVLEIAKMRQQSDRREEYSKRVTVYQNLYQKHRGNIVYTVDNQDLLTHKIIKFLREGKRVAVPTNIKGYGEFLHKKIMDLDINVTVSLSTGDTKPTRPLIELWKNVQCMIYSPTILAGNSYEETIDVICGYFEKSSCDQADALQMLMRCRDVSSKLYYICFKEGPGKSPIPTNVYQSTEEVKKFFMKIKKSDMIGWLEEDILSLDIEYREIRYHNLYFNSYVNFMKQGLVSDREYLFRMLLYMRDCGFKYGGNIYAKTDDKEAVAAIKLEKKEYSKQRNDDELDEKYTCADATTQEYLELTKKTNKTKDDIRRMLKYSIKRIYKVDNVPKWLFKIHNTNYKQYNKIKRYININGVTDKQQRDNLMSQIEQERLGKNIKNIKNQNAQTVELLQATDIYNPVDDIEHFWTERDIKHCVHALTILESIGATYFVRDVSRFEISYDDFNNINRLKEYIVKYEQEIRELVNDFKISIDKLASKVTNKAFGIKFTVGPTGYTINNLWIKNPQNILWPVNNDPNDREELRILVPESTISDKVVSWINNKITIDKNIVHAPPTGAYDIRNKVTLPAATPTKVPQVIVQQPRRIQAQPIIISNLKLVDRREVH